MTSQQITIIVDALASLKHQRLILSLCETNAFVTECWCVRSKSSRTISKRKLLFWREKKNTAASMLCLSLKNIVYVRCIGPPYIFSVHFNLCLGWVLLRQSNENEQIPFLLKSQIQLLIWDNNSQNIASLRYCEKCISQSHMKKMLSSLNGVKWYKNDIRCIFVKTLKSYTHVITLPVSKKKTE